MSNTYKLKAYLNQRHIIFLRDVRWLRTGIGDARKAQLPTTDYATHTAKEIAPNVLVVELDKCTYNSQILADLVVAFLKRLLACA